MLSSWQPPPPWLCRAGQARGSQQRLGGCAPRQPTWRAHSAPPQPPRWGCGNLRGHATRHGCGQRQHVFGVSGCNEVAPQRGGGAPASLPHMAPGARDAFGQGHRAAPAGPVQQFGDCMRAARLPQGAAQRRCPNTPLLGHSCTPPQCVACSHPRAQLASAAGPRAKLKPRAMVKTHVSHHHYDVVRFILEVHLSIRFD